MPPPGTTRVMEHEGTYLAELRARGLSPQTVERRKEDLGLFWRFLKSRGVSREAEVRTEDVEAYRRYTVGRLGEKTRRPLSPTGIHGLLAPVKHYFAWLEKRRRILKSPAADLTWSKLVDRLPEVPSVKDMEALLAQPNGAKPTGIRDRAILELMYSSGLRGGEVPRLDVYDVDLMERTVRVREGKGKKDRVVPFGETARKCLGVYLKTVRHTFLKKVKDRRETALFLNGGKGAGRLTMSALRTMLKVNTEKALGRSVSLHKLRHAFATHMVAGGADIRRVQEMLGHALLSTTQIYTRVKPVDLKEAHRRCHPRTAQREK